MGKNADLNTRLGSRAEKCNSHSMAIDVSGLPNIEWLSKDIIPSPRRYIK